MDSNWGFLLKVLGGSLGLAIAIKWGAPLLAVPASPAIALILVLLPTLIMAGILGWKGQQSA